MTNYPQHASLHRAALLMGLTNGASVIAWADDAIANDADAPAELFELAMVPPHDLSELRHALQPLAARAESRGEVRGESLAVVRALLDRARNDLVQGKRSVLDTITVLAQARRFLTLPSEYLEVIDTLQDDHMLATAGITGDVADVETRVRCWLNQFAGGESAFLKAYP